MSGDLVTRLYVLTFGDFIVGVYSTWDNAALARKWEAEERGVTPYNEQFHIQPARLDFWRK